MRKSTTVHFGYVFFSLAVALMCFYVMYDTIRLVRSMDQPVAPARVFLNGQEAVVYPDGTVVR